tara:strand:+ start:93 stop:500 length:408 start_codon:yes stop_codon:yes gene_type:complete
MANVNLVVIAGNVTRDIELRHTNSGKAVCEVGLAVNNRYKGQDGNWVEEPVFVDVTLWGRQAEIAEQYCRKGTNIHIEGELKLHQWQDKNSGQQRQKLKVTARRLQLLGDSQQAMSAQQPQTTGVQTSNDDGMSF